MVFNFLFWADEHDWTCSGMMGRHALPQAMLTYAKITVARNAEIISSFLLSAGGQELQIGISQFASYRGSDIKVQIGGSWAQIQAQTDHGVNVTLPALAAGWYNVSVTINGIAVASTRCVNACTFLKI